MASPFEDFMASVSTSGQPNVPSIDTAYSQWLGTPQYKAAQYQSQQASMGESQSPWSAKINDLSIHGQAFSKYYAGLGNKYPAGTEWLQNLYQPAFNQVAQGTFSAGALARQAYEDLFRARAAGYQGQMNTLQSSYGAQVAGQGLSQDVAQRMLAERSGQLRADLAGAQGEASAQLSQNLGELAKGTASEFAGLTTNQANLIANYLAAQMGANAVKSAAPSTGATLLGSTIGGALGKVIGGI